MKKITHSGKDVDDFFQAYIGADRQVLLIGTLGFNDVGNYFASALAKFQMVDYRFFVEKRVEIPAAVLEAGAQNRTLLDAALAGKDVQYADIEILTEDTAPMGGRYAVKLASAWLHTKYTDVVVDATSMSRGVCFSTVKFVTEFCHANGMCPHIVVAERELGITVKPISSDVACYMHGFQGDMETDAASEALKLWVPQLSERAKASLEKIFATLQPQEVCPVLPFPATKPRRADDLLVQYRDALQTWDVSMLDVIYAHESNPIDVCATIERMHLARQDVFKSASLAQTRTILSPSGWRVGSIGMLLAALELDLPVMYTESIGYSISDSSFPAPDPTPPECRWHVMLMPNS